MELKAVYEHITDQVIAQLEKAAFARGSNRGTPRNLVGRVVLPLQHNGTPFRGVNIISPWMYACVKGYLAPRWMTFKSALGDRVRRGEDFAVLVKRIRTECRVI